MIQITTATLPRRVIDAIRRGLRHMVANVIYDCSSPFDFAIVLLQLLEEIVGSVEQWKITERW